MHENNNRICAGTIESADFGAYAILTEPHYLRICAEKQVSAYNFAMRC